MSFLFTRGCFPNRLKTSCDREPCLACFTSLVWARTWQKQGIIQFPGLKVGDFLLNLLGSECATDRLRYFDRKDGTESSAHDSVRTMADLACPDGQAGQREAEWRPFGAGSGDGSPRRRTGGGRSRTEARRRRSKPSAKAWPGPSDQDTQPIRNRMG